MAKGRDIMVKDKRSPSPLLSRKSEIGQQRRSPNPPSIVERKKALACREYKKIPIYYKPTISSILYARNPMKQPFFDNTKLVPQYGVTYEYIKTIGSTKPKDVGKPCLPLKSLNNTSGKKQARQPTNALLESKKVVVEKKPRLSDVVTHVEDHKTVPIASTKEILVSYDYNKKHLDHEDGDILNNEMEYEDGGKNPLCEPLVPLTLEEDQDMVELDTCFLQDNVTVDECIDIEVIDNNGCDINQQSQVREILHPPEVDQETTKLENKQVVQEAELGSKDVGSATSKDLEHEKVDRKEIGHEEPDPKEVVIFNEGEVPKEEDHVSKELVENRKVVAHGKKDAATYKHVIEETKCDLPEKGRKSVKALVGAFETFISLESHVMQR